jgi:hypothetical protein
MVARRMVTPSDCLAAEPKAPRDPFARRLLYGTVALASSVAVPVALPLGDPVDLVVALLALVALGVGIDCFLVGVFRNSWRTAAIGLGLASGVVAGAVIGVMLAGVGASERLSRAQGVGERVAVAIARHRHEQGRYPISLDQLVPTYLDAIPEVQWRGSWRFRYQTEGDEFWLGFESWTLTSSGEWNHHSR